MNMGSGLCETGSRGGSLKMLSAVFGKSRGVTRSQTPPPQRQQASINRSACVQDAPMGSASEAAVSTSSAPCDGHGLTQPSISYGLPTDLGEHYELGHVLGQGGNAVVVRAISRRNAKEYACKCLPKVLKDPSASDLKRAGHQQALRRELDAVRRLSGALNVAAFEAAFEDDDTVYILTELCKGGELWHRIGEKHYSERTVASYMRAVLRTLAQFHSHHLLHRDVKPGNFLLLSEDDASPLRAIDFGLAVHFDPDSLPRSDLGLEGTPWYMAPEVLSSAVVPASDVWSAGVMAHQLLTGRFPFDDRANRAHPAISKIWQSILLDKVDFKRSAWDGISQEARDFVGALLQKDPAKRPTAKQALKHPWLKGSVAERSAGRPLSLAVVQRIQRYGQSSLLKRSALEFIAEEMLAAKTAQGDEQSQQGAGEPDQAAPTSCPVAPGGRPIVTSPSDSPLEFLYAQLSFAPDGTADRGQLSSGLQRLGYKLEAGEAERLLDAVDTGHTGRVAKGQFAASQIDWGALQRDRAAWLARARSAFEALDADGDGVCGVDEIVACLARKLPLGEVGAAVRDCMAEAAKHEDSVKDGLSFEQFLRMLRADSRDSLDQYDDRMGGSLHGGGSSCGGSVHGGGSCRGGSHLAALLDRSVRAGEVFQPIKALDPVAEAA